MAEDESTRVVASGSLPDARARAPDADGRIGAYRLVRRLGRGGMGEVWLAERADAAYSKQVAIKFIATSLGNPEAVQWFRRERQALASLEHPHIARLLDGGEAEDGRPYLVMEFVDGVAIDDYLKDASVAQILRLFLQVCAAVEHAHRALIVHRDIKPANVLVTAEGQARLLDFGIASEMGLSSGEVSETTAYTLHYASPEQMDGRAVTVASDVYSLGALLYRLVSGTVPHANSTTAIAHREAIQTRQPERPSRTTTGTTPSGRGGFRVNADLDAIILKCLRGDPAQRYGSVRELIDDIGRYQGHYPVHARQAGAGYHAARYLRRNWLVVAAATALLVTLAGGLMATRYQAQLAEQQRALAQKRFDLSRALVNEVLFDFQDRLANVPGTIGARRELVNRTKTYLQNIAADAQHEPGMLIDLSLVERRLGDMSGNPSAPNIGDTPAAGLHYQRAVALVRKSMLLDPDRADGQLALARALGSQGNFFYWGNDLVAAEKAYAEAIPLLQAAQSSAPSATLELELAKAIIGLADTYFWSSKLPLALATYDRACKPIFANTSQEFDVRDAAGGCHIRRADALAWMDRYPEAEAEITRAIAVYAPRYALQPGDLNVAHAYSVALNKQGEILSWSKKLDASLATFSRSLQVASLVHASDPNDLRAARDLAMAHNKRGDALLEARRIDEALTDYRAGVEIYARLASRDPTNSEHERDAAISNHRMGIALVQSGRRAEAIPYFDAQLDTMRRRWRADATRAGSRRDLTVALEDRVEAPAAPEQLCAWFAESRDILLSLKQDGSMSSGDQAELDKAMVKLKNCPTKPPEVAAH